MAHHPDRRVKSVFMPPVNPFSHRVTAHVFVNPPAAARGDLIRNALFNYDPRRGQLVRLAASSLGNHMAIFRSVTDREYAVDHSPYPALEHAVTFRRHEDAPNRYHFHHFGYFTVSIWDFPYEHWCRERIRIAMGAVGNPAMVSPACLSGLDYSAVLVTARVARVQDVPDELHIKAIDGVATISRVALQHI
ncbi:hypothetical protein ACP70R_003088 [Stipagrostis hirtigluma subsp. patula]